MSGNSTGGRVTSDVEEPAPTARGPWLGEVTGLRLGDVPEEDEGSTGKEKGMRFSQSMMNLIKM